MLRFKDWTYSPAFGGHTVRRCQHCPPDPNGLRYWSWSDDQASPCPCCGRTEDVDFACPLGHQWLRDSRRAYAE